MGQHFLLGDESEIFLIRTEVNVDTSTVIGSNPTRKINSQRKLVIQHKSISASHLVIKTFSKSSLVRRLNKTGFVSVNGTELSCGAVTIIRNGDDLKIGDKSFQYCVGNFNHQDYLRILKRNQNYTPITTIPRK